MSDYKLVPKSTVDELAQFIRKVDGNHKMGAGAVAEKICERFRVNTPAVQGEPVAWQVINIKYPKLEPATHNRYPDWAEGDQDLKINPLYTAPQPAGAALPPEITREMLGTIIDEVFGGGIEDASVIEDIYRVIARSATPQPAEQQPIKHDWDDQDKCRRCGDRDWYASATCSPKQQPAPDAVEIGPNDLIVQLWSSRARSQWDYSRDRGVKITHVPSGITVTCETEGSVYANKEKALRVLEARLTGWFSPDVTQLVEALVACARASSAAEVGLIVDAALAAYRKQGGEA